MADARGSHWLLVAYGVDGGQRISGSTLDATTVRLSERPFGIPTDIELDLPAPPSTNRLWMRAKSGKRHVFTAPEYREWKHAADGLIGAMAQLRGIKPLLGAFECTIILSEKHTRIDLDNAAKCLLDYAKRCQLITDDGPKYLRRLLMEWGYAPHGARMILRAREP